LRLDAELDANGARRKIESVTASTAHGPRAHAPRRHRSAVPAQWSAGLPMCLLALPTHCRLHNHNPGNTLGLASQNAMNMILGQH